MDMIRPEVYLRMFAFIVFTISMREVRANLITYLFCTFSETNIIQGRIRSEISFTRLVAGVGLSIKLDTVCSSSAFLSFKQSHRRRPSKVSFRLCYIDSVFSTWVKNPAIDLLFSLSVALRAMKSMFLIRLRRWTTIWLAPEVPSKLPRLR